MPVSAVGGGVRGAAQQVGADAGHGARRGTAQDRFGERAVGLDPEVHLESVAHHVSRGWRSMKKTKKKKEHLPRPATRQVPQRFHSEADSNHLVQS